MTPDDDFIQQLEGYLDEYEGTTPLPDSVRNAVRARLRTTTQFGPISGLMRDLMMDNNIVRVGLVAAAVVIIAVIAFNLLPGSPAPGGTPTPSLPSAPTDAATPSPAAEFPADGELTMGRYSMTRSGVQLSVDVPAAGWSASSGYNIFKGDSTASRADLIFWTDSPDNVYSDPCAGTRLSPPSGTTAAELAASVAAVPGTELIDGPSAVTVGGRPAQNVVLRMPGDPGCSSNDFHLWYDEAIGPRTPSALGSTIHTWIIDVDGVLVWIDGEVVPGTEPELEQEMQDIIDSIVFE